MGGLTNPLYPNKTRNDKIRTKKAKNKGKRLNILVEGRIAAVLSLLPTRHPQNILITLREC